MKRAMIIVKGKVQKVRYRSKVKVIANRLGVLGEAENLDDGSVRIVAEAEKSVLDEFIEKIKIKNYLIDVQDVSVSFEDATGEFSAFKKVISGTMYEVAERLDEAADILERLTGVVVGGNEMLAGKQDQMLDKQDQMLEKQDQTIGIIKNGVDETREFRTETHHNFANLDIKYGKIAENMERILEEMKEERKEYRESIEKLVNAIIESKKG